MRHKIPEEKKKKKFSITIDDKLGCILNKYLESNNISNKSKYIENLIRNDMEKRGEKIEINF